MRHRQRHVHATILRHVKAALTADGWIGAPVNWGEPEVTVLDYEPQQAGVTPALNTVSVSIGHQGSNDAYELGGLLECSYTLFIDVYPTKESIGVAIADDIKDSLDGVVIRLRDFTTSSAGVETDDSIEFEDIEIETLTSNALDKRSWRSIKSTAVVYFL